jgi:hypothetical protein
MLAYCLRQAGRNGRGMMVALDQDMRRLRSVTRLTADYWRERAAEARAQAAEMRDPVAKRTLLAIAENYEQLAAQAEVIRKTSPLEPDKT